MGEGLPKAQAGLWGDLKITDPKWKGQPIPFTSLSNEVKQTALKNAQRAEMEAVSKLRAVDPKKQLIPSGLMKFAKGAGKLGLRVAGPVGMALAPTVAKARWDEGDRLGSAFSMMGIAGLVPEFFFDRDKMTKGFQESLSRTKEARESRYENLLMDRRHRQRRKELKGQGLLGLNI